MKKKVMIVGIILLLTSMSSIQAYTNLQTAKDDIISLGLEDLKAKIQGNSGNSNCFTLVIKNDGEPLDFLMLSYRIYPDNSESGYIEFEGTISSDMNYYDISLPGNLIGLVWFRLYLHLDSGTEDARCEMLFFYIGKFVLASPIYKNLDIQ